MIPKRISLAACYSVFPGSVVDVFDKILQFSVDQLSGFRESGKDDCLQGICCDLGDVFTEPNLECLNSIGEEAGDHLDEPLPVVR